MANGMVERFNQNLKNVIHTAYNERADIKEAVDKYMAAYRNMPHTTTGQKPSKLMWNKDIKTKLPSLPTKSTGKHHKEARKRDQKKKDKMVERYNTKHRTWVAQRVLARYNPNLLNLKEFDRPIYRDKETRNRLTK